VVVNGLVELLPFRGRVLVKTPRSHYLQRVVRLCVQAVEARGDTVLVETYRCEKSSLHFPEFGD
jgi:hypothetical protein